MEGMTPAKRLKKAILDVEKELDGEVILYSGPINENGYGQFVQAATQIEKDKRLILVLVTYGGLADSAYRIARYAQNYFKDFVIYVPSACKSAGTLLALGSSKIHMSPFGEFGPLDVQVFKADELFERRSGLLSKSAVWSLGEEAFRIFEQVLLGIKIRSGGTVGFKTSSNVAATITAGLLGPVMSQLDPLAIGEDYQNLHIAQDYGHRLVQKFETVNADAVAKLVEEYPSHGFVIDYFEAVDLFGNVEFATKELLTLSTCLGEAAHRPNKDAHVLHLGRIELGEDDEQRDDDQTEAKEAHGIAGDQPASGDHAAGGDDREGAESPRTRRSRNGAAQTSSSSGSAPE